MTLLEIRDKIARLRFERTFSINDAQWHNLTESILDLEAEQDRMIGESQAIIDGGGIK